MGTKRTLEEKHVWFQLKFREAKKQEKYIEKKKFLAEFCLSMSSSQDLARSILRTFEDFGTIRIHKDRIEVLK